MIASVAVIWYRRRERPMACDVRRAREGRRGPACNLHAKEKSVFFFSFIIIL